MKAVKSIFNVYLLFALACMIRIKLYTVYSCKGETDNITLLTVHLKSLLEHRVILQHYD